MAAGSASANHETIVETNGRQYHVNARGSEVNGKSKCD